MHETVVPNVFMPSVPQLRVRDMYALCTCALDIQ